MTIRNTIKIAFTVVRWESYAGMRSHRQSQHYTGDRADGFLSQKMDKCLKAREDNEQGFGEDPF